MATASRERRTRRRRMATLPASSGYGREVTDPITPVGWFTIGIPGGKDRRSDLRRDMQETLRKVAAVAEEEAPRG